MTTHRRSRPGMTLVEVLIAAVLTVFIAGAVYGLLSAARHTASLARARGEIKTMAEVTLRQLERDISASRVRVDSTRGRVYPSFQSTGNGWTMIVPEGGSWMRVDYLLELPRLTRVASAVTRVLCAHVKRLEIAGLSDGQVSIDLEVEIDPPGATAPVSHRQTLMVTIREVVTARRELETRWRSSEDVVTRY